MTEVAVIGVGSPHGADRAGWQALDALHDAGIAQRFRDARVSLVKCSTPTQLYPAFERCSFVILIDAVPGEPGHLTWFTAAELEQRVDRLSVHGVGVGDMLALLEILAERPPQLAILGIGVEADSDASPLDKPSQAALCCLRGRVEQAILRFLAQRGELQKNVSERA